MRRRSLITFVVLNVFISLGVALAVISALNPRNRGDGQQVVITVPIVVTATIDPNITPQIRIITATPLPGAPSSVGQLPTGLFDSADLTNSPVASFDVALLSDNAALQGTATALPSNCILHTVKEGDTPFGIAEQYGADGFALMEVNGLNDTAAANMQIGDTLIVPLEGCTLTAADLNPTEEGDEVLSSTAVEETEDVTPTRGAATPTVRPTVTIPPTAANAKVTLLDVTDAGDVTAEGVEIENTGDTVNIARWTLSDADGNEFTFPEQFLFSNARVTVYTRAGSNTAIAFYWGRDASVWEAGDVVTLKDDDGVVQSTYRVP
jgi:hypothetical protein